LRKKRLQLERRNNTMADVNSLFKKVLSAVHGKDVRQSIHDLIKTCYEELYSMATVKVSTKEPTETTNHLWINPEGKDNEFSIPEIKDDEINTDDTWSSKHLDTKFKVFTSLMVSGEESGALISQCGDDELITSFGFDECVSILQTPSQAYNNGFVATEDIYVTGIKLKDGTTSTSFGFFVFDSNNTLIESYPSITIEQVGNVAYLNTPIALQKGQYILVRFLNGNGYYVKHNSSKFKEYQPGTGNLINSPIKLGIEFIYVQKAFKFASGGVKPSDYILPRCSVVDGEFTFIGRWFDRNVNGKTRKCANADGSSILFKVNGASKINIGLYSLSQPAYTPYFAVSIDGSEFARQKISDTTVLLPDDGEHIVWIVVDGMGENDPVSGGKWYGTVGVYFTGVTGGTTNALDYKNRQILFIGDSIVEGINVLGAGANADVNSATNGFAFKTARLLNAIPLLCGYGGTAVLGNSSFHKPIEAIDYNMNGVKVNELDPDIVVVEHGYNDGSLIASGTYASSDFTKAYGDLLDRISVKYPGVVILCLIPFKQSLATEIKDVVNTRKSCYVIETANWGVTYTDQAHPDKNGSNIAASKLSTKIIDIMGKTYFTT
jgi:hypothetical protein